MSSAERPEGNGTFQAHHDSLQEVVTELERVYKLVHDKSMTAQADGYSELSSIFNQEAIHVWSALTVARHHAEAFVPQQPLAN